MVLQNKKENLTSIILVGLNAEFMPYPGSIPRLKNNVFKMESCTNTKK